MSEIKLPAHNTISLLSLIYILKQQKDLGGWVSLVGLLFFFPHIKQKFRPCEHETSAINTENSFLLLSFHNASSFLLISVVHGLLVNVMLSARTLKGTLVHCFCLKCIHFLPFKWESPSVGLWASVFCFDFF